jgi:hypothetical protein
MNGRHQAWKLIERKQEFVRRRGVPVCRPGAGRGTGSQGVIRYGSHRHTHTLLPPRTSLAKVPREGHNSSKHNRYTHQPWSMVAVQGTILVSFIQHFLPCLPVFICTADSLILHSWNSLCRPAFLLLLWPELSCIPDSTLVRAVLHSWFHFSQSCPAFLIPLQLELSCIPDSTSVRAVLHSWFHFSQSCPAFLIPLQSDSL